MSIFRSIGFGIFIITLSLLLPDVLTEGRETAISFLRGARISADTASAIAASVASAPPHAAGSTAPLPRLAFPHATSIPRY